MSTNVLPTTPSTSDSFGTIFTPDVTIDHVSHSLPSPHLTTSTLTPAANTWTTFIPSTPRVATMSTNVLPTTIVCTSAQNVSHSNDVHYLPSIYRDTSTSAPVDTRQDEKVQHSQQLIEALAKVTQVQRLPQARSNVFRGTRKTKQNTFFEKGPLTLLLIQLQ